MIPDPILLSPESSPLSPDPSQILGFEPWAHIPCYDPALTRQIRTAGVKQRYWDSLCETEAFHQARHRTAGFYCILNVRDVSVLVAYYAGYLLSRHCELWPKMKSQILLSDKCTTNLSFQSIVDPTGVWRSTWLFHHICYTSQRLEYLVTFPVNKMYFTWNV